jgi:hypothetical protein
LYLRLDQPTENVSLDGCEAVLDRLFHGFLKMLLDYPALQACFQNYVPSAWKKTVGLTKSRSV